ncbi:hypothetical protein TWF225_001872 [Orbilia oligospora]|uniref:Uncharacterized protein n=1 Tax=Orbilia oligospora TaxID=2813651 RepID=A0A7C8TTR6_ORBOL|nr:hypothetical protein TWF751_011647 [Orbilia oligospora]KAF3190904.1 hypothetical protein TWF225_001872 [Orbilia oligospora]KAF3262250.1 hypothetical protein TWF217_004315 [Orbilia oligospora]KAF3265253.1 hypothetical protein TWF128_000541 [Orbilia oligospora]TGJ70554.1 hypothetical protein EYR41_002588 [Orbilia oligospora]
MFRPASRSEVLKRFRNSIHANQVIIGSGAGSLAGLMPYGDANAIVCDMGHSKAQTVLPQIKLLPVIAGVCATDPFRDLSVFLPHLRSLGFVGIQNFPTVRLIDGNFRQALEETGMSYDKEVEMIALAHYLDFLTIPYVFTVEQAVDMTNAGADVIVVHFGLTNQGSIGAKNAISIDDAAKVAQEIRGAVVNIREDIIVLVHGGPISTLETFKDIMKDTKGVHGFLGASTFERIPLDTTLPGTVKEFKELEVEKIKLN